MCLAAERHDKGMHPTRISVAFNTKSSRCLRILHRLRQRWCGGCRTATDPARWVGLEWHLHLARVVATAIPPPVTEVAPDNRLQEMRGRPCVRRRPSCAPAPHP
jgi:hypothetical protein